MDSKTSKTVDRFRKLADSMQTKIDNLSRPMTQNPTPKRNYEFQARLFTARNMERGQRALRALAYEHEAGTISPALAGLKDKAEILRLVAKTRDHGRGGYYSFFESDDYAETGPVARELQSMLEGSPAQRAEVARKLKINQLSNEAALMHIPGFFPSPRPVVEAIIDEGGIIPGMTVLDPEAGSGNIADGVLERCPDACIKVIEPVSILREILDAKGYDLVAFDFLECTPDDLGHFDRIFMNPPFEEQADIDHVRHAYEFLSPGGILVSVMSPSFEFRQNRKSVDFRDFLADVKHATVKDLPEESFKASGTSVGTKLVSITR